MVDRDDILPVNQNTATERVVAVVVLPLNPLLHTHLRRAENGDHLGTLPNGNAARRRLVRSQNVRELVAGHELVHRLLSVAHRSRSPLALSEPVAVEMRLLLVSGRIGPQKVRDHLLHRQVLARLDVGRQRVGDGDLVDHAERRALQPLQRSRNAAVDAEDGVVDGGCQRQTVEDGVRFLPDLRVSSGAKTNHHRDFLGESLLQLAEEAAVPVVAVAALEFREFLSPTFTAFTSWFPRRRYTFSGSITFWAKMYAKISIP